MTAEITATSRRYPVIKNWLIGMLSYLLASTTGADYEFMALIKRVKSDKVSWRGAMPCRDWTKK